MRVTIRALPLNSVQVRLGSIDLCNGAIGVDALWEVPPSSRGRMSYAKRLIVQIHVDHLMSMVSAVVVVHLLTLQLVLNTFAVGSIPDKWQNRTNALNKKGALGRLRIVKCSLENISKKIISKKYKRQLEHNSCHTSRATTSLDVND